MQIRLYQIDAFTDRLFSGNPAAVCALDAWLEDTTLQRIALENNLSDTAFLVSKGEGYELRWFTPTVEVDLCGHATLASAFVVFKHLQPSLPEVSFSTGSGVLTVRRNGDVLSMDFPAREPVPCQMPELLAQALGNRPCAMFESRDYMAVFESEEEVRQLKPNMALLEQVGHFAVIVTAPSRTVDFVSRFFAPASGIPEDPVTGSAHCTLVPYWAKELRKTRLHALQVSARGGELWCEHKGDRVLISGKAVQYLEGTIEV